MKFRKLSKIFKNLKISNLLHFLIGNAPNELKSKVLDSARRELSEKYPQAYILFSLGPNTKTTVTRT